MDIVVWLRSRGLGKYEAAFRENEIDETILSGLTAEDLKDLGVLSSGTIAVSSMLSLFCVATRAARLTPRLHPMPRACRQMSAPNAAK
jgi:SAM domain (Sterile alpha motif)